MTINVSNLVFKTHEENFNLCDEQNNLIYVRALQKLNLGMVFCVENFGALPPANTNKGKIYYVNILERVFWSDGSGWRIFTPYPTELWTWGTNSAGKLGIGNSSTIGRCSPVREFCSASDWCQVFSGRYHTSAIKASGELWVWGCNNQGRMGDGTTIDRCSPVREFFSATDWCQVSNGNCHTVAIKTSGQLWTWGCNSVASSSSDAGLLGDGTTVNRSSPVREFCRATDWCQASGGVTHTVAIKTSGQLWTWGSNCRGELGIGISSTLGRCSPIREFCSATDWCQIRAGQYQTIGIKTNGEIWSWGRNNHGQIGDGTTTDRYSPVREFCSATNWCSLTLSRTVPINSAIKTSGELWIWGRNFNGALGDGTVTNRCSPVREFCSATDWCMVSNGGYLTAAIKISGQLWTWGLNTNGPLGDGTTTSRCSPVREFCSATDWCQVTVGYNSIAALKLKNIN
jgi:alpha-tubulin suppressor-like RCC1 family protein